MSNPVELVNFDVYQFSTYRHQFNVVDSAGAGYSLSGYTARLQIRDPVSDALLHESTSADGITMGATNLTVEIPGSAIGAWTFSSAVYDLFIVDPLSAARAIARGSVKVFPSVTQI